MALSKSLPKDIRHPGTNLLQYHGSGDYFSCYDSFFEFVVAERFPRPFITKVKEKLVPAIPVIWHERNLPKTELENYTTTLDFHVELAVLYLIPITPMKSLSRLANTMFEYLEWRFMIGESVLVYQNDEWRSGRIIAVRHQMVVPTGDIFDGTRYLPEYFLYEVSTVSPKEGDVKSVEVRCQDLRRPAGTYSRTLLRSCILQHCKCREPIKTDSVWSLKNKTVEFYDLNSLSWWDMYTGPEPRFPVPSKPAKHFPRSDKDKDGKEKRKSTKDKHKHSSGDSHRSSKESRHGDGKRKHEGDEKSHSNHQSSSKKMKYSMQWKNDGAGPSSVDRARTQEDRKLKQQEYKKRWREKMKKDKEKITNVWAQVFSVGEDLQCTNLKPIPIVPRRLETGLPDEFIGDGLFILEFLRIFGSQFDKALQFIDASVWDLDRLLLAFSCESIDGDLTNLLCFCAKAMMACAPYYPPNTDETAVPVYPTAWQNTGSNVLRLTQSRLGISFFSLPLTSGTLSEVIRMCLLVSSVPLPSSPNDLKSDGVVLRHLKSPMGVDLYRVILARSVYALSFPRRVELVMLMIQAVMESGIVRETVDRANSTIEELERSLKTMKSLSEEVNRMAKGKIAGAARERDGDKASEKTDKFRQLLEHYTRKRSGRSERDKSMKELVEDMKALDEGRRKRRLLDTDFSALSEAMADLKAKFDAKAQEERQNVHEKIASEVQNFRTQPLGTDRHFFKYWFLPNISGLLIEVCGENPSPSVCAAGCLCETVFGSRSEGSKGTSWWRVTEEKDFMDLKKNLLINGEREVSLKRALDAHCSQGFNQQREVAKYPMMEADWKNRVVPTIAPAERWELQLLGRVKASLLELNSNLQENRFGGLAVEELEQWSDKMEGDAVPESNTSCVYLEKNPSSPEISEPSSRDRAKSPDKILENGVNHDEDPPISDPSKHSPTEAYMEPVDLRKASVPRDIQPKINEDDTRSSNTDNDEENASEKTAEKTVAREAGTEMPDVAKESQSVNHLIECVAQLVDTIGPRYLGAPLVTIDEDFLKDTSQLNRWNEFLRTCSTISQISLYVCALERCILWQRSTVNGTCKACRKRGDSSNLVSCDRCDRIYHWNCVIPPLEEIPQDEWACPVCIPVVVPRGTRRARNAHINYNEDSATKAPPENATPVEPSSVEDESIPIAKNSTSSRAARALLRNRGTFERQESVPSEDGIDDGLRRSRRKKRVDYKELADGSRKSQPVQEEEVVDEEDEEKEEEVEEVEQVDDEPYSVEENQAAPRRRSGSEDSEYDPDTKPRWGKKHKRPRR